MKSRESAFTWFDLDTGGSALTYRAAGTCPQKAQFRKGAQECGGWRELCVGGLGGGHLVLPLDRWIGGHIGFWEEHKWKLTSWSWTCFRKV